MKNHTYVPSQVATNDSLNHQILQLMKELTVSLSQTPLIYNMEAMVDTWVSIIKKGTITALERELQ